MDQDDNKKYQLVKISAQVKSYAQEEIEEQFICICCTNVVLEPVECSICQKWFCRRCIQKWLSLGHNTCPQCKQNFNPSNKLHLYLQNKLESFQFKCEYCEAKDPNSEGAQAMSYSKYCKHIMGKCPQFYFPCPFQCEIDPAGAPKLYTQEELAHHVDTDCPNVLQQCDFCGIDVERREFLDGNYHDCVVTLKNEMAKLKRTVEQKDELIVKLEKENAMLKNQGAPQQSIFKSPDAGTNLTSHYSTIKSGSTSSQKKLSEPTSSRRRRPAKQAENLNNDFNFSMASVVTFGGNSNVYPNLRDQFMDMDSLNQNQIQQDSEQMMQVLAPTQQNKTILIAECNKGHDLHQYKQRNHIQSLNCRICEHKDIQEDPEYFACEDISFQSTCSFYVCLRCRYV